MKDLIANFSQHLQDALHRAAATVFSPAQGPVTNVVITGLGGSGIGGTIVSELVSPLSPVPVLVNKNYHLPEFVDEHTLVIGCSYSGNTEETLSAVRQALQKKAAVICICSGGQLEEIAWSNGLSTISMPGGNPPRSMFGYSFVYLLHILRSCNVITRDVQQDIKNAVQLLEKEEENIQTAARQMAESLHRTVPALYAVSGSLGIASRWRQQLNENAKMLAWEAEIPEMNHNELVGWEGGSQNFAAVFLRHHNDYGRNQKRIEIIKKIIAGKTDKVHEVWSKGNTPVEQALYLIHWGDWLSYYLSEMNGVDIMDIKSIDLLKSELSKFPV